MPGVSAGSRRAPVRRSGCALVAAAALVAGLSAPAGADAFTFRTLGQPNLASTTLASRCPHANARFNFRDNGGFKMYGPSGIAVAPGGRLFVTDFGGGRVLSWPDTNALSACQPADRVIGAAQLEGPEAVAVDSEGKLYVADTLAHAVRIYRPGATGNYALYRTLGLPGTSGAAANRFHFPRGLAVGPGGRLFVADDSNQRVLIFNAPFTDGEAAVDSIGAGADGGFAGPKAVATVGHALFVADHGKNRVLRFTGPFNTPAQVYESTAVFRGVGHPVDLTVGPDGTLLVTDQTNRRIASYERAAASASKAAPDSSFADHIGPEPLGIAADLRGRLFVADYRRFRVLIREPLAPSPVDPAATAATRALLADLRARPDRAVDRVAIGQQLITWLYGTKADDAWYRDWSQLEDAGLPLPLVMAGELSDLMSFPGHAANANARNEMIAHGQAGGIVSLVWHPDNPTGGPFGSPITTGQLRQMRDPATAVGAAWRTQLNRAAAVLQRFEDAGVPVLFRPLHEQNGDFFWWGHNGSRGQALADRQAAWTAMWRDLVRYLTVTRGLHDLAFVFGTNQVNYGGVAPVLTYFPGGDAVDAVSIDVYDEELDLAGSRRGLEHYDALVGTGEIFGLAEFGQSFGATGTGPGAAAWDSRTLTARVSDSYPATTFAIAWYSSVEGGAAYVFALPDVAGTPQLLAHPLIDTQ